MFRRTAYGLCAIASITSSGLLMRTFQHIGHWDLETTGQFFLDLFWWPHCQKGISEYVKSSGGCQQPSQIPKY